jgi:hypothetical protein
MIKPNDPIQQRIRTHASRTIRFLPETPARDRLKGYKQFLKLERQMIHRMQRKQDSGLEVVRSGALMVDACWSRLCARPC